MQRSVLAAATAAFAVITWAGAGPAAANVTVFGGGYAEACSKAARSAADRRVMRSDAIETCNRAIELELLTVHDLAGTYVNRGVLYLSKQEYDEAKQDFDAAARLEPELGEAYVNRGAALIGQGHDVQAIADIDKGLALSADEPEKAYFNRAIAKERLDDLKGAYFDYRKALELKPDWTLPQTELARFTVVQR